MNRFPGIDLVYLPQALKRKRRNHPRYREIVFDPSEINLLEALPDDEISFHICWAAKEAAYKAQVLRSGVIKPYIPNTILIGAAEQKPENSWDLTVTNENRYRIEVRITDEYVLATTEGCCYLVLDTPGMTKKQVREYLTTHKNMMNKNLGRPVLYSHTHDGSYAALAWYD